ncbi:hypothetical protein ACEWY4_007618 [Coilia grayii]|uniref:Transposase element L1Md-A101/L1Md-A102/L1Md-A2 n=1 Tax=Coilia grayii TaxID=363190 RepID=A0ABD1KGR6_9TELE
MTGKSGKKKEGAAAAEEANVTPASHATILEAINSLRTDLQSTKTEICQTIDTRIAEMASTIRGELSVFQTEIQADILTLQTSSAQQGSTIAELEQSATHSSDAIVKLQSELKRLCAEVDRLTDKCADLEGRSRRQNIRIVGLTEGAERGTDIGTFVSGVLKDALSLEDHPLVDRAHRVLRKRTSAPDPPPRALIARLHYYRDVTRVLKRAAETRELSFNGQSIRIFPDFTPDVAKRRAAFNRAKELLRDQPGVRYGMLYPAKLRVTFNGTETVYTDATKACEFAELHFGNKTTEDLPVDHDNPDGGAD